MVKKPKKDKKMVTRLYFPVSDAADVNPSFDAGWEANDEAVRRKLQNVKGADTITAGSTINMVANSLNEELDRQYVSNPMDSGIVFTSAVTTVQMQLMVREFATTDNVDRGILGVRIVDRAGTTVQATLLAVANYSTTAEFINNATMRNKTFANGDTVTSTYTTAQGDRLVVEMGYQNSTGSSTTPQAAAKYGQNATDLPINETQTTDGAGWIEFSNNITFEVAALAQSNLLTLGVG